MKSTKSLRIFVIITLMMGIISSELVVTSFSELVLEDSRGERTVDRARLVREAELVNVTRREICQAHYMEVELWRFWSLESGEKEEMFTDTILVQDITSQPSVFFNVEEPWIQGIVANRPYLNCFEQEDDFLIDALRENHIKKPSDLAYNFSVPESEVATSGQYGQPWYLDAVIFKGKVKDGFFIEAGADDFELDSNSLHFELEHGWTGLLVEPNPTIYPKGFLRQRKAWGSSGCLATQTRPHIVPFTQKTMEGGMAGIAPEETEDTYDMQCFPLYSLLMAAAANVTVNYLSLDIEGAELQVLQTLPWDKLDIEVITVETAHAGEVFPGSTEDIRQFLQDQGYVHVYTVAALDDVFVRKDLYEGKYAPDLEKQKLFEIEMDGNQPWYAGLVKDDIHHVKPTLENVKVEL